MMLVSDDASLNAEEKLDVKVPAPKKRVTPIMSDPMQGADKGQNP